MGTWNPFSKDFWSVQNAGDKLMWVLPGVTPLKAGYELFRMLGSDGNDVDQRQQALLPRLQAYANGLGATSSMPDYASVLPSLASPDTAAARNRLDSGFSAAEQQLNNGLGAYQTGLQNAYDSRMRGVGQLRNELSGMFNFGEDPYARALLDFTQGDISNRRAAAADGTQSAFNDAVSAIQTQRANIDPARAAAEVAALYENAAAAAAATNASTAADIASNAQGVVGVGPASGSAADTQQATAANSGIAGNAARANAQIARDTLDYMAANTTGAGAARRGELENAAMAAQAEATRRFMEAEQARIARERDMYRQADLSLREQELMAGSDLQSQLAEAGLSGGRDLSNLALSRAQALADLEARDSAARAETQNAFAREIGARNMDWLDQQGGPNIDARVRFVLDSAGAKKGDFVSAVEQLLTQDQFLTPLIRMGIVDKKSAERYWEQNYKNLRPASGAR